MVGVSGASLGVVTASGDYDNSPDRTYVNPLSPNTQSKADCPSDASTASGRALIQVCLSQWNEFVPAIPRYGLWYRDDQRTKGPLKARLAYNARTGYLLTVTDLRGNAVYRDATGYLDGRLSYRMSRRLTVFLEARNMTGENERSTNDSIRLVEDVYSGKRYFAGLTLRR